MILKKIHTSLVVRSISGHKNIDPEENISPWLRQHLGIGDTASEVLSILLVVIPLTYANVVLGELVPKTLALRRSMFIASITAPWLNFISGIIDPIVSILEWSTKKIINMFPKQHTVSDEAEANLGALEDVLSPINKQYIMNMVKIERTKVREIFVEWKDVVFVDAANTMEEVEKVLITSGHTRVPILKEGNVIGILNSKEFLAFQKAGNTAWTTLSRPIISVLETTLILTALRLLQQKRAHMAIVYNGSIKTGIVTMEAVFEEIIGDIYDEDDDGAIKKILSTARYNYDIKKNKTGIS